MPLELTGELATPVDVPFEGPPAITDAMVRRSDALELLEDRLGRSDLDLAEMILDDTEDDEVLGVSVETLAAIVAKRVADAEIDGEYDEDGFGHAWVTTKLSFADAQAALQRRPTRTVRSRPRGLIRTPRSRRRAGASRRARSPGRSTGDDEPEPDVDHRLVAA